MSRQKNQRNIKKTFLSKYMLPAVGCLIAFGLSITNVTGDGGRRQAEIMSDVTGSLSAGPDHGFLKADPASVDTGREEDPKVLEERGSPPRMGPAILAPDTNEEELRTLFEERSKKWIPLEGLQTDGAGFVLIGKITGASAD